MDDFLYNKKGLKKTMQYSELKKKIRDEHAAEIIGWCENNKTVGEVHKDAIIWLEDLKKYLLTK